MLAALARLEEHDTTVVQATHDVDFALAWVDVAAAVVDGVVRQGEPGVLLGDDDLVARARLRRSRALELAARLGLQQHPDLPPPHDLDGIAARLAPPPVRLSRRRRHVVTRPGWRPRGTS